MLIKEFVLVLTGFLVANALVVQDQEVTGETNRISNFLAAAESGDTAKVAKSLSRGIEINVTDEGGQTALMLAADQGHIDTVKVLLQHRPLLDLQNKLGGTALMMASFNGHFEVVTELLKSGADVNAKAKSGYTALIVASARQNETAVQIINLLLDQKADINTQDQEGYTALMTAIDVPPFPPPLPPSFKGTKEQKEDDKRRQREAEIQLMIVKTLVMRGADLDLKDKRGRTALEIARINRQNRISEFLKSR
jgi:ankyrin repeat protein